MRNAHESQGMSILNACLALAIVAVLVTAFLAWATH